MKILILIHLLVSFLRIPAGPGLNNVLQDKIANEWFKCSISDKINFP